MNRKTIVLASASVYRSQLLSTLKIPFVVAAPDVDETPLAGEDARQTSLRLSESKARAVGQRFPSGLVIGSDQVALLNGTQLGKPLVRENAVRQLNSMRGHIVVFHTALCLLDTETGGMQTDVVSTRVKFRQLTDRQIEHYLDKEQPYHCAGSAKTEGLGIALIEWIEGNDPNALIGLPLISLINMLHKQGVDII